MLGDFFALLYMALFLWAGLALARRLFPGEGGCITAPLGCAFAVAGLAMLPAAAALFCGFGLPAALLAGAAAALAGACACANKRYASVMQALHNVKVTLQKNKKEEEKSVPAAPCGVPPIGAAAGPQRAGHGEAAAMWVCVAPLVLLTVYLLYTHVLWARDGAYYTGQSGYGDVAMHLAFIKSIAVSGEMPPTYPLLAGQTLFGYPFLCESVSSVFLLLGAGLKFAYILPEVPALVAIFGFGWLLARRVTGGAATACVAYALFFLGGGFGFAYFFGSAEAFRSIFTGFYTTPTNDVAHNIRWVNCIADLLVPQRATLMGWALALPCLYLLYRFAFEKEQRLAVPLGLLAGCLPLMQTHSLLALVLLSAVYLVFAVWEAATQRVWGSLLPWAKYAAVGGVLCLPQLFGVIFRQTGTGQHFLVAQFNWINTADNYFWFYIKNLGIVYLLLLPAFLWADRRQRRWFAGALAVLAISEVVLFQPNAYDNIKLLFFWFLYSCILVAGAVCDWLRALKRPAVQAVLLVGLLATGTVSSVLTLGREAVSCYQTFDAAAIAAGEYVDENAEADALFLTGMQHLNPVASLAGRHIVCGSTLYVYFHGMNYAAQESAAKAMYETPSAELLTEWGVDYVYISSYERADYAVDEAWYAANGTLWYRDGEITIYRVD